MQKVKTLILVPFALTLLAATGCDTARNITAFDNECTIDANYRIHCEPNPEPPIVLSE